MSLVPAGGGADDLRAIATEQRRELMAAISLESDLDLAFHLQLQEALTASLSLNPSTSSSSSPPPPFTPPPTEGKNNDVSGTGIQSEEIVKFEQEMEDRIISETEFKKMRDDLHRRIHDQKFAQEIQRMSEEDWEQFGDDYEKPYGEGSSSSKNSTGNNEIFKVYFKGFVETEATSNGRDLGGIGVAITDSRDQLLFEISKPLFGDGTSKQVAGIKALIEGFNAALALDFTRIMFFCDQYPVFQYVTGKWAPKQRKITALMSQVVLLRKQFEYCEPFLVPRNEIKFAFKLAREAIVSQINRPAESSSTRNHYETCVICLEDADINRIFSIDDCMHRYCYSCMKQHAEVKLLHGMLPKCPHEDCNSVLNVDSCSKFLTVKLVELMKQRVKEDSIPVTERVYCPYPKCSALMSKSDVLEYSRGGFVAAEGSGARRCKECNGCFCIDCKVPWHQNMTCVEYKRRYPNPPAEDVKLKTLAARNLWRQCIKCNHMIELATGCYHMTCRCGYEFCYTCGSEWKNKKAACACPLWDEDHIMDDSEDDEDDVDDEFDEELDFETDSDDY